jgi:membrane associated rhomboid family serine protease
MDSTSSGLGSGGPSYLPPGFDPYAATPIDRPTAIAVLNQADDLMNQSEPEHALALYTRAIGVPDRDVSAAGFYGAGNALYRLDRESEARQAWERAAGLGETPVAYRSWRQLAAALVREGDLRGAVNAYRQCEKRAPREDRPEIASRLGWLNKEIGNTGAATKYFKRSRGDALQPFMTYLIIAITVVVSLVAMNGARGAAGQSPFGGGPLEQTLGLDKFAVAHGEFYRLLSVVLVHDPTDLFHLLFNMYALWYAGQLVERMYGSALLLGFYVLCGIAGSVGTYVFGDAAYGVGASGAIFGLFGVVLVATRYHHAVLDQQSRAVASQVGVLIVLNLVLGFSGFFNVDNFAHIGGLLAGLWLALLIAPAQVPTLASLWQTPGSGGSAAKAVGLRLVGVLALVAVLGAGVVVGTSKWQADPYYRYFYGASGGTTERAVAAITPAPPSVTLTVE